MRFHLYFFIFLLNSHFSQSQSGNYQMGAKSAGIGDASVTLNDPFTMFNNIGGIAGEKNFVAALAFRNRFGLAAFNSTDAGIIVPNGWGNTSINVYKFGDDLLSEHKLGLGYANKFGLVSLGLQVNYLQYHIEGFGTAGTLVLEMGGIAEITPQLFFGAHIFNLNQARFSSNDEEKVATVMKAGLSYRPIIKLMINIEAEKDIDVPAGLNAGLEYQIVPDFSSEQALPLLPDKAFMVLDFGREDF
jgi:hypothetical protein